MPQRGTKRSAAAAPGLLLVALAVAILAAGVYIVQWREPEARVAAAVPAAPATPLPAVNLFTSAQQEAVLQVLQADTDPAHKAWFLVQQDNPESAAVLVTLRQIFAKAGWPTETARWPNPLKSGVFLLAGDSAPPAFVGHAKDALTAGGLDVQFLTGYRDFVAERKRANPSWVGPELTVTQSFVVVIGGKPILKPAS